MIDALAFPVISGFGSNTPPVNPAVDTAWFTGTSPTGAWFDQGGKLAFHTGTGWRFAAPLTGMIALDALTGKLVLFDGSVWQPLASALELNNLAMAGINTTADVNNRLAVKSNAVLATALPVGSGGNGDIQVKVNKEASTDTGSLLFQTNWSGRAEMGLAGEDNFSIKVSDNGSTWATAISISGSSGIVTLTDRSIANAALANMASGMIKGRSGAGDGIVEDLTGAQVTAMLPVFTTGTRGLVPAGGSSATAVLRANGTWFEPDNVSGPAVFRAFNDFPTVNQTQDWTFLSAGTSAAFSNGPFGASNSIGAAYCNLGTTATGRGSIAGTTLNYLQLGQGLAKYRTRLRVSTLSDATNTWTLRAGFLDSTTGESTDCAMFRYSHSENGGRFVAVTRSNSSETFVDTGVAAVAATNYILEIQVNANANAVEFFINGALVATIATNIPASTGRELGFGLYAQKSTGTTNILAFVCDYILVEVAFTNPR